MNSQKPAKINQLLQQWPKGTVATQTWLDKIGIYRQLTNSYVKSGWMKRLGQGAFIRSGDEVDWKGGLLALQTQLGMTVHVAARTALELQGQSHFLPLGRNPKVMLFSDRPERLPSWYGKHPWRVRLEHRCTSLFDGTPTGALTNLNCGDFCIKASSSEQAVMEQIYSSRGNDDIDQVYTLMEGLNTMRPKVVQQLLEACRSVKVKRLFLWCAETAGHTWFEKLDLDRIDLGMGKRHLYKGGRLDLKYQITIPKREELPGV